MRLLPTYLSAEGEKLQKASALGLTPSELPEINRSVESMANSIINPKNVPQRKLELSDEGCSGNCCYD